LFYDINQAKYDRTALLVHPLVHSQLPFYGQIKKNKLT